MFQEFDMTKHGSFVLENDDSLSKLPCGNVVSEHNPTQKNRIEVRKKSKSN